MYEIVETISNAKANDTLEMLDMSQNASSDTPQDVG